MTEQTRVGNAPAVTMQASDELYQWLEAEHISFGFTTYQANRLFLVGRNDNGRLAVNERLFDKPMGLYAHDSRLYLSTRYQIWQLEDRLSPGERYQDCDRLYIPSQSHTTGDMNVHDLAVSDAQEIFFINSDFSCLGRLQTGFSFAPVWMPPFISKLVPEDRCHLNGLAMQDGQPAYVTACSTSDVATGWRNQRTDGGVVMHIPTNEIVVAGLSMPHSPRWYQGKLWVLNSGTGEFGYIDGNRFRPVIFCPGFVRGLAFWKQYALVGLSKLRSQVFTGLALEQKLIDGNMTSQCGLAIIDLDSGKLLHVLHIEGVVEELFDVVVIPNVIRPKALGFQDDEIDRLISFPGSNGLLITKPTVNRPGLSQPVQKPGVPRISKKDQPELPDVRYQKVLNLTPENLLAYEHMSQPSLRGRWSTHPQRGALLGMSASVDGKMIGFVVAESWQENDQLTNEIISSYVSPAFRHYPIEQKLHVHLQRVLQENQNQVSINQSGE